MRKVTSKDYFVRPSAYRSIQEALFEENKSTVFPIHDSVKKYYQICQQPTLLISLLLAGCWSKG